MKKQVKPNGKSSKSRLKTYRTKEFTFITYLFFALFVGLMIYFVLYLAVFKENYITSPYNSLQDLYSDFVVRGEIQAADGTVLAETTVDSDGNETRTYPQGREYAHVVGYSVNGKSGLENATNYSLLRSHEFFVDQIINDFQGEKNQGDTVVTTLDTEVQGVAYNYMAGSGYEGAVVVMKPSTGEIIAMVSLPDFDPNTVEENWDTINADGSTVLYNRATQGQYAPGSTFKLMTTLEYYRENSSTYEDYSFDCTSSFTYDGKTIHCAGNETHGTENLESSFANSCNCSYANIGLSLDQDQFMDTLNTCLFNKALPIDLESNKSKVSLSSSSSSSEIMETSIGQGKTYVTPLHMCMLAGAVDNDGVVMKPYLVDHTENVNGVTVKSYSPQKYATIMTEEESDVLESCMSAVTEYGTASRLSGNSYQAYGKTGTAQVSDSTDAANGWFIGYAKKDGYDDIAVAVIVEDCGSSSYAVPIAQKIFDAYFN